MGKASRGRAALGALWAGAALAVVRPAGATETVLDDFESGASPSPWVLYEGTEFPGATGSLTSSAGHSGKGAHLAYDLTAGGRYVSATLTLPPPRAAVAVGYWVKAPGGTHAKLRVRDATGQTFQYDTTRPLEAVDASAWYHEIVQLDAASSHFGGANDGTLHQPLAAVTLLAADPIEAGTASAVDFDDVSLFDTIA